MNVLSLEISAHVMLRWYDLPGSKACYLSPTNGLIEVNYH